MSSKNPFRSRLIALSVATSVAFGCGGAQSPDTAAAGTASASASAAVAPSASASAAPVAVPAKCEPGTPENERGGLVVVSVEPTDAAESESVRDLAKRLAKALYGEGSFRPRASEVEVRALVGQAPPADDARATYLAGLRAALSGDLTAPANLELLRSIGERSCARAVVVASRAPAASPDATAVLAEARIVRVGATATIDPVRLVSTPGEEPWPDARDAARRLLGDLSPVAATPVATAVVDPPKGTEPLAPKRAPGPEAPKPPDDDTEFYESPWFWVAVGGVAAIGLTAVIVSQTVDTNNGSVHLSGKVLE